MPRRRKLRGARNLELTGTLLPERRTTILETVLKPLEILNIPQQAAFRSVRALQEGSFSALGEHTRLSDIAPVERGGVGEFIGTIALDPLNFVGGVAAKTATGAARKTLTTTLRDAEVLTSQLKAAKIAAEGALITKAEKTTGILEHVSGLERELELTNEAAVAARTQLARVSRGAKGSTLSQSTLNPDRALLRLDIPFTKKGIDIGNLDRFPKLLDSSKINKQRRLVKRLKKVVASQEGDQPTAEAIRLAKLERALLNQPEGVLNKYSPALALRVARQRSFLRKHVGNLFKRDTGNAKIDVLREIRTNRRTGRSLAFRGGPLRKFNKDFQELFKESEIKDIDEFNKHMTEAFEFRRFLGKEVELPSVQDEIDQIVAERMNKEFFGEGGQGLVDKYKNVPVSDIPRMQRNFMAEEAIEVGLKQDNLRQQLDKIAKVRGKVRASEIRFVNNWGEHFDEVLDIEKAIGINIEKESSSGGWLSYLTRLTTKEALLLKKKNAAKFDLIHGDVTAHLANALKRKMYPKSDIVSINELMREKHGIDFDWYDTNVIRIITKRFDKHIEATGNAQMAHAMFDIFGVEGKNLKKGISQEKYFKSIGMKGGRDDLFISDAINDDARQAQKLIAEVNKTSNTVTSKILSWVDKNINTFYRTSLTSFFPPFHNRNFIGNIMLNRQAGMGFVTQGKFLSKMRKLQWKAIHNELNPAEKKLWQELADMRIRGEGQLTDIERELIRNSSREGWREFSDKPVSFALKRLGKRKFLDAPDTIGLGSIPGLHGIPDNPITSFGTGRSYGILIEEQSRGAHYLWKRDLGFSPLESQRSVNKYLFDYQALSPFEKKSLAPAFLFYTWSRKNIPLQLKEMIQNPRLANVFQNITGYDQEDAPMYLRNGVSFPIPGMEDTFIGTLGLPLEVLKFP